MGAIDRRLFLAGAGALIAGVALPGAANAQVQDPRPPTVDTDNVREIADGVFVIGDHRVWLVPNIGIVVGKDAALVIDCGLGPANGEAVLAAARRIAGSHRELFLTVTHFHPEHGYGAQAFQGAATIVYNPGCFATRRGRTRSPRRRAPGSSCLTGFMTRRALGLIWAGAFSSFARMGWGTHAAISRSICHASEFCSLAT